MSNWWKYTHYWRIMHVHHQQLRLWQFKINCNTTERVYLLWKHIFVFRSIPRHIWPSMIAMVHTIIVYMAEYLSALSISDRVTNQRSKNRFDRNQGQTEIFRWSCLHKRLSNMSTVYHFWLILSTAKDYLDLCNCFECMMRNAFAKRMK